MGKTSTERLADAGREVEISRRRLRETQENVVRSLEGYAADNNFARLIADSLAQGRRKGTQG